MQLQLCRLPTAGQTCDLGGCEVDYEILVGLSSVSIPKIGSAYLTNPSAFEQSFHLMHRLPHMCCLFSRISVFHWYLPHIISLLRPVRSVYDAKVRYP